MAKQQQVKGKPIKKSWYGIVTTEAFDSTFLGESYVTEPSALVGKVITVNLANLTGDIRQQGISLSFKIIQIKDEYGIAIPIGYEASSAQLKRVVRRGVQRLDDSFLCNASDGKTLKVKPFAVTRSLASQHKLSMIRKLLRNEIAKEISKHTFDGLIKVVISNQLQTTLKSAVKKILPLKAFEIRKMELLLDGTSATPAPTQDKAFEESSEASSLQPQSQSQQQPETGSEATESAEEEPALPAKTA